jgi:hypothetical protein
VSVDVELLGDVLVVLLVLGYELLVLLLGDVVVAVEDVSVDVDGVVLLELGVLVVPYVELVPLVLAWLLLVEPVLDVGFVEAVVFRLPLVFSFVVLVLVSVELLDGAVLYIPALELLELGAAVDDWFHAEESVVALVLVFAAVEELV